MKVTVKSLGIPQVKTVNGRKILLINSIWYILTPEGRVETPYNSKMNVFEVTSKLLIHGEMIEQLAREAL